MSKIDKKKTVILREKIEKYLPRYSSDAFLFALEYQETQGAEGLDDLLAFIEMCENPEVTKGTMMEDSFTPDDIPGTLNHDLGAINDEWRSPKSTGYGKSLKKLKEGFYDNK